MSAAVVVVDMLNRYEHEDAEPLRASVEQVLPNVQRIVEAAVERDLTVIYVNDNHGDWTAGRLELTEWARDGADASLVDPIAPGPDIPLLLKARHSGFYDTQLEYLLKQREADAVIVIGQVTEQCILYTALDAYVREFDVILPRDAVAHIDPEMADAAVRMMERNMHTRVLSTEELLREL
ncbi:MAG: cysteine hydrolase [Solirubrobacterales bacterium]|nr:cysteine hydrolase [Solirubrobacterales bacterium]